MPIGIEGGMEHLLAPSSSPSCCASPSDAQSGMLASSEPLEHSAQPAARTCPASQVSELGPPFHSLIRG